ncbi:MAG TPA: hypothetical protein VHE80_04615, partial [Acidimicrobiales bacterium]|nr:hypothetical protein [Acidimicrobiales bacterium]
NPCSAAKARDQARWPAWWRRPPDRYWMHAACLRRSAHPSVTLQFLAPPREANRRRAHVRDTGAVEHPPPG